MAFEVRPVKDLDEFTGAIMSIGQYFGMVPNEERMQRFADLLTLERTHGAWSNGAIVGGAGAFTFNMTVPGGDLPTAGVSVVGVFPTHRRRGVLRSLMRAQSKAAPRPALKAQSSCGCPSSPSARRCLAASPSRSSPAPGA